MNRSGFFGAAAATIMALQLGMAAPAQADGPFDGLQGSWAGTGTLSMRDGTSQRMQCRVQYTVAAGGTNLQQALRCNSDSQDFRVNAFVLASGSALSGNWTETTRNVSGNVTGKVAGNRITINVAAGNVFSASMVLVTTGARQNVTIVPQGTDVSQMAATLRKG